MRQVVHIFRKEFSTYFVSPIAYIVIAIFLLVTGWFFFATFFLFDQASLRNFFSLLPVIFSFVIPAITMRLFAEELSTGSYETLLTLPVTFRDIILGKFLAGVAMVAALLVPTLSYPIFISFIIFMIVKLSPSDPTANLPLTIPPEVREQIRESLGVNEPLTWPESRSRPASPTRVRRSHAEPTARLRTASHRVLRNSASSYTSASSISNDVAEHF